jgi:hypothetical protein
LTLLGAKPWVLTFHSRMTPWKVQAIDSVFFGRPASGWNIHPEPYDSPTESLQAGKKTHTDTQWKECKNGDDVEAQNTGSLNTRWLRSTDLVTSMEAATGARI